MAFPLETNRCDETLDLGSLVALRLALLQGEGPPDDVLPYIIFLCVCVCVCVCVVCVCVCVCSVCVKKQNQQLSFCSDLAEVVEFSDLSDSLGPETTWHCLCRQSRYILERRYAVLLHTHTRTHTHTHTHASTFTHTQAHTNTRTHTHTHTSTHSHTHRHTQTHARTHARTHAHTHTHLYTFLDNDQVEHAETPVHDAPVDRLSSPLSLASRPETRVPLPEEQLHSACCEDALLHGESLLVIASRYSHYVTLRGERSKGKCGIAHLTSLDDCTLTSPCGDTGQRAIIASPHNILPCHKLRIHYCIIQWESGNILTICGQKVFSGNTFGDYCNHKNFGGHANILVVSKQNSQFSKYKPPPNIPWLCGMSLDNVAECSEFTFHSSPKKSTPTSADILLS